MCPLICPKKWLYPAAAQWFLLSCWIIRKGINKHLPLHCIVCFNYRHLFMFNVYAWGPKGKTSFFLKRCLKKCTGWWGIMNGSIFSTSFLRLKICNKRPPCFVERKTNHKKTFHNRINSDFRFSLLHSSLKRLYFLLKKTYIAAEMSNTKISTQYQ